VNVSPANLGALVLQKVVGLIAEKASDAVGCHKNLFKGDKVQT
jgi:hypothetical protein